jgi:hypothetical protein
MDSLNDVWAEARTASKGHDSAHRERQVEEEVNTRLEAAQQVLQQVDAERERERLEREQERQAAESRQTFLAAQIRDLRTTLAQIQKARAKDPADPTSQAKTEPAPKGNTPGPASGAASKKEEPSHPSPSHGTKLSEVAAAQLDATEGAGAAKWKASAKNQAAGTKTQDEQGRHR